MAGGKSNIRKPLSPVKANEQKLKHANKPARSTKPNKIDFAAQSATKPKEQPAEAVRSSKIPRATPSPGPRRLSVGPSLVRSLVQSLRIEIPRILPGSPSLGLLPFPVSMLFPILVLMLHNKEHQLQLLFPMPSALQRRCKSCRK